MVTALVVMPTLVGALMVGQGMLVLTTVNRVLATLAMQIGVTRHTMQPIVSMCDTFSSRHDQGIF